MTNHIKVGITHGDINGISYEIIAKVLAPEGITELFTPVVFGYPELLEEAAELLELERLPFKVISAPSEVQEGIINVIPPLSPMPAPEPGKVSKEAGKVAVEALEMAVDALKDGCIDVLVTAPISKEAVQSEKFNFPGHTEFLESRLGEESRSQMILFNDRLRIALLTIHLPLSKVAASITEETIVKAVESFAYTLKRDFGAERPSIAILSLNPHAGDGGMLGNEEKDIIEPAIRQLQDNGILAFGPFPADGFFGHGSYANFDGILAMYHDQGLAPFKTLVSSGGVNFTSMLPYVRTSPDHGTAFDIAWKGEADPSSLREAIYKAIDIYRRRKSFDDAAANPLKKFIQEKPDKGERLDKNI